MGHLYPFCNMHGSVVTTLNQLFVALTLAFADIYISRVYNITHMHTCGAMLENSMRRNMQAAIIEPYFGMSDEKAVRMIELAKMKRDK